MTLLIHGVPINKINLDIRKARVYINELNINKFSEPLDEKNIAQSRNEIIGILSKNKPNEENEKLLLQEIEQWWKETTWKKSY